MYKNTKRESGRWIWLLVRTVIMTIAAICVFIFCKKRPEVSPVVTAPLESIKIYSSVELGDVGMRMEHW